MSSWSPPAFLKSNGQVGNGGTLRLHQRRFRLYEFAKYWYDSLLAYKSNGVSPTWISIQNEPDWAAGYDSCVFHPTEDTVNGTNYRQLFQSARARLSAPDESAVAAEDSCAGSRPHPLQRLAELRCNNEREQFLWRAHHLYGDSTDGTPDGFKGSISALDQFFPAKPQFMTEYGITRHDGPDRMLIHNALTVEQVSGYNFWNLIWPGTDGGLIQIENPLRTSRSWTNAPPGTPTQSHGWWLSPTYWAMKHFSYFIQPGFRRVAATCTDANVLTSAYLSPDGSATRGWCSSTKAPMRLHRRHELRFVSVFHSSVYQTAGTNYFQSLGSVGSQLTAARCVAHHGGAGQIRRRRFRDQSLADKRRKPALR